MFSALRPIGLNIAYRYLLAVLAFVLALALRFVMLPVEAGLAFITFYPTVFFAYYILGVGPGTVTMVLSAVFGYYIFLPPYWNFSITANGVLVTATFVLSNILVAWLVVQNDKAQANLQRFYLDKENLQRQLNMSLIEASDLYTKSPVGIYSIDKNGIIIKANQMLLKWLGASESEVLGRAIFSFFNEDGKRRFREGLEVFKRQGFIEGIEFDLIGAKGNIRKVSVSATAVLGDDGELLSSRSVMFDVTELDTAKRQIENQNRLLDGVVEGLPFGVAVFDNFQRLKYHNKTFQRLLDYQDVVLNQPNFAFRDLIRLNGARGDYPNQDWEDVFNHFDKLMQANQGTHLERQSHNGTWLDLTATPILNGWMVLSYVDITENKEAAITLEQTKQAALNAMVELSQAHEKVQHIAYHDQLTSLPNRRLFADRAEQAIAVATRQKTKLAVCYLDLDGFKQVNDRHGHSAGDALLIVASERLTHCVRAHDTVCRLGGDEFVLLLTSFEHEEEVLTVLQRVLVEIAKPVSVSAVATAEVSVSIGYAVFPDDASEKGLLLRRADHAMYEAKKQGKNCIVRFLAEIPMETKASI